MSTPLFEFDPRRAVAFDVEAYPGRWLVGFYGRDRHGETRVSRVVDGDRAALGRTLTQIAQRHKILVGYNSSAYDVPMLWAILGGATPTRRRVRSSRPSAVPAAGAAGSTCGVARDCPATMSTWPVGCGKTAGSRRSKRSPPISPGPSSGSCPTLPTPTWARPSGRRSGRTTGSTWSTRGRSSRSSPPRSRPWPCSRPNTASTSVRPASPGSSRRSSSARTRPRTGATSRRKRTSPSRSSTGPRRGSGGPGRPRRPRGSTRSPGGPSTSRGATASRRSRSPPRPSRSAPCG